MRRYIFIIASFTTLLCACQSAPEPIQEAEVDGFEDMEFPYDGKTACSFTISSGYTWSLDKDDCDWIELSQESGRAGRESNVTVKAGYNDDLARSGKLTLSSGSFSKTVVVSQAAFPVVPEMKISCEVMTDEGLHFGFKDSDPVLLSVWSSVDWTLEKENLEWLTVTPQNGTRKETTEVTIVCDVNNSEARSGRMIFNGPGLDPVVINVSQDKYVDDPVFIVTDTDKFEYELLPIAPDTLTFTLRSNRKWTVTGTDSWLEVTPASNSSVILNDTPVTIIASENRSATSRNCTITFDCEDSAVEDIKVVISQKGLSSDFSAVWTLDSDVVKRNADWTSYGVALDDSKNANMTWMRTNEDSCYGGSTVYTYTNSNNTYMVKSIWTDDCFEFEIPVTYAEAGTEVLVKFDVKANSGGPRFWFVEYLSGDEWIKTSTTDGTVYGGTDTVECTSYFTNGVDMAVRETFKLTATIVKGKIKVRLRCADGRYLAKKSTLATVSDKASGIYFKSGSPITISNNK